MTKPPLKGTVEVSTVRLTRRGWLLLVALPCLLLVFWLGWKLRPRWAIVDKQGSITVWRKGDAVRTDSNGDHRVDEETTLAHGTRMTHTKKDTDLDGWYDIEYDQGAYGIAINLRQIKERAPRH